MTTADDQPIDRRDADKRFAQMEAKLLTTIENLFLRHNQDMHIGLDRNEIQEKLDEHEENQRMIPKIVSMLEGKPIRSPISGEIIRYEGGLVQQSQNNADILEKLDHRTNGGVVVTYKTKREWSRGEKIGASSVGAFITISMLPTFLGVLRYAAEWITSF